ncbi:MAG TPA: hypothetical protein VFP18_12395, partial [Candidatus Binatia bacterium]|nr:hypothetical protein [Candidatus Binatia bacterium]
AFIRILRDACDRICRSSADAIILSIYLVLIVINLGAGSSLVPSRLDPTDFVTLTEMPLGSSDASASTSLSVDFNGETTPHERQMIGLLI